MTAPLSPAQATFLSLVPADGSSIGNGALRAALGWDEATYAGIRDGLVAAGLLEKGRGRGGSVRRTSARAGADAAGTSGSASPAPTGASAELFAPEEIETVVPELERARRAALEAAVPKRDKAAPPAAPITDHRFAQATRKNLPAAGDALGKVDDPAKITYAYDPHRSPVLRFQEDIVGLRALLDEARRRPLTSEETARLAALLEAPQPWLEWTGKRETPDFTVEPVALHIHERVSAQAILKAVRREDIQRDLFAEAQQSAREARAYYQHDVAWANRLITGDSLQVMTSLARREGLAGQVQMIYVDPPYGIKFSSNWQNEVGKRDVKDKDEDLSREPEMIRAYRDTWTLGVHSYLAYLKQRLIVARELLKDSGSIFVQISDENLHRVRAVLDEVFGAENFCNEIKFTKTSSSTADYLSSVADYIIFYAKDRSQLKYRALYLQKGNAAEDGSAYSSLLFPTGERRRMNSSERNGEAKLPASASVFRIDNFQSQSLGREKGEGAACWFPVPYRGTDWRPSDKGRWKTNEEGMVRLSRAERFDATDSGLYYLRKLEDFPVKPLNDFWTDTSIAGFASDKVYVVQTATKIIERCMLMTTDPGDLVLDPTCGSGTTAYVAEQWGRRWITIDSSRVAVAIARQRLLTACYDTYKTKDPAAGVDPGAPQNPAHGFFYKTVPHITLKSIAQNKGLDPIFARHEPILAARLAELNAALATVPSALLGRLVAKLQAKVGTEGARAVTDADLRRWLLPSTPVSLIDFGTATQRRDWQAAIPGSANPQSAVHNPQWREWEVPFDTDPDWPAPLAAALTAYRTAWRAKMDEVNAAIAANAEQEELVDQPEIVRGVARVAGPFTVESMRPPEASLKGEPEDAGSGPIGGAPDDLETFETTTAPERDVANAASHIDRMLDLLQHDGLTFTGNKHVAFTQLDRIESSFLHAEGEFQAEDAQPHRVAIVIGPEFGSVTSYQVEAALRDAYRRGYDDIVFAGFSFDAMAQEVVDAENERLQGRMRLHLAMIRPDVGMGDLLKKTQKVEQIFTVFGQPRTRLESRAGELVIHMEGVDLYDPVANALQATGADKVAAWFLDTDYDGKVFCICQAFFPDKTAWEKLSRALKTSVSEGAFEALGGTTSLPFQPGPRHCVAVKVIDPRGNEVMRVHRLDGKFGTRES